LNALSKRKVWFNYSFLRNKANCRSKAANQTFTARSMFYVLKGSGINHIIPCIETLVLC
jgi:hypothetical protein